MGMQCNNSVTNYSKPCVPIVTALSTKSVTNSETVWTLLCLIVSAS
jgi:hypothetical protein